MIEDTDQVERIFNRAKIISKQLILAFTNIVPDLLLSDRKQ
jgi:hypothetical protein